MDTKLRSWVKSIVWRVIGIILLGAIAFAITGNWKEMTAITILFHGTRVIMYYYHERIWEHISWGKLKHPLSALSLKGDIDARDLEIIKKTLQKLGYI